MREAAPPQPCHLAETGGAAPWPCSLRPCLEHVLRSRRCVRKVKGDAGCPRGDCCVPGLALLAPPDEEGVTPGRTGQVQPGEGRKRRPQGLRWAHRSRAPAFKARVAYPGCDVTDFGRHSPGAEQEAPAGLTRERRGLPVQASPPSGARRPWPQKPCRESGLTAGNAERETDCLVSPRGPLTPAPSRGPDPRSPCRGTPPSFPNRQGCGRSHIKLPLLLVGRV